MNQRDNMVRFGVLLAIVIVAAVLGSFGFRLFGGGTPAVELAPVATAAPSPPATQGPGQTFSQDGLILVEVTPDTVQEVVATLSRLDSYSRVITVEQFWADDTRENGMASAVTQTRVWVDGGYTRADLTLASGRERTVIVGPDTLWSWTWGEYACYTGAADSLDADLAQYMPTYEAILDLEPEQIVGAGYERKEGVDCILTEAVSGPMGYTRKYWVSVESGLLMAAEAWEGERLIYRMSATQGSALGEDAEFRLPDGTVVHEPG